MYKRRIVASVICFVLAFVSFVVVRPFYSKPENNIGVMHYIDKEMETNCMLSVSSVAAAGLISALPNDTGTPIANQLTQLSQIFLFILAVLTTEKYLLPIIATFSFGFVIPVSCICAFVCNLLRKRKALIFFAKVSITALLAFAIVPIGVHVSNSIHHTFEASIETSIQTAINSEAELVEIEDSESGDKEDNRFFLVKWGEAIGDAISGVVDSAVSSISSSIDSIKNYLTNYLKALAVMIVIDCVIPILVLILYIIIIKKVFSLRIDFHQAYRRFHSRIKENAQSINKNIHHRVKSIDE